MANNDAPENKGFGWYVYWKMDRTVAILSLLAMVIWSLVVDTLSPEKSKVVAQAIGVIAVYIGARSAK